MFLKKFSAAKEQMPFQASLLIKAELRRHDALVPHSPDQRQAYTQEILK